MAAEESGVSTQDAEARGAQGGKGKIYNKHITAQPRPAHRRHFLRHARVRGRSDAPQLVRIAGGAALRRVEALRLNELTQDCEHSEVTVLRFDDALANQEHGALHNGGRAAASLQCQALHARASAPEKVLARRNAKGEKGAARAAPQTPHQCRHRGRVNCIRRHKLGGRRRPVQEANEGPVAANSGV